MSKDLEKNNGIDNQEVDDEMLDGVAGGYSWEDREKFKKGIRLFNERNDKDRMLVLVENTLTPDEFIMYDTKTAKPISRVKYGSGAKESKALLKFLVDLVDAEEAKKK